MVALLVLTTVTVAPATGEPILLMTLPLMVIGLHMLKQGQSSARQ
jgi:hypothetical protein